MDMDDWIDIYIYIYTGKELHDVKYIDGCWMDGRTERIKNATFANEVIAHDNYIIKRDA